MTSSSNNLSNELKSELMQTTQQPANDKHFEGITDHEYSEANQAGIRDWKVMTGRPLERLPPAPLTSIEEELMNDFTIALFKKYDRGRVGVHVSDITLCPREAVFRRLDPKEITIQELSFFIMGEANHATYQALSKEYPDKYNQEQEVWLTKDKIVHVLPREVYELAHNQDTFEQYLEELEKRGIDIEEDLVAHIDLYNKQCNMPIEIKTYRGTNLEEPKKHQAEQLKAYATMLDADTGLMFYQLTNNFDELYKHFPLTFTKEEKRAKLIALMVDRAKFVKAMQARNPSLARHIANDPMFMVYPKKGTPYNWKCRSCKYKDKCDAMRQQAGEVN